MSGNFPTDNPEKPTVESRAKSSSTMVWGRSPQAERRLNIDFALDLMQ